MSQSGRTHGKPSSRKENHDQRKRRERRGGSEFQVRREWVWEARAEQQLHQGTDSQVTGNKKRSKGLSGHCQGKRSEWQVPGTWWGEVWAAGAKGKQTPENT